MKIAIMAQLCSLMLAADCDGESCKEGSKAAGDETSLLQTSSLQTLKRSAGNKMTVMVFTFNAGEAELKTEEIASSHIALKASMKKRLDALSPKPDIVMFSSQEFVNKDYHPLKSNMDLLPGYKHIGNTFISGGTKFRGATVRTSIEVAVNVGIKAPAEDEVTKSYQHFYFLVKSTKGMARLRATIGEMLFRFVGIHLDTKDALHNLKTCAEWVNAKENKHGTGLSILAGDYNTRLKSTADVTCDNKNKVTAGVKAAFKVPSDGTEVAFLEKSDIYKGLSALSENSGLKVHMPFPPLGDIGGDKYFMPTYKLEGCDACTPNNVFDHVICDAEKEKKSKAKGKGEVSVGLLDYFTVLYDETKYKVESDNLNWDPQPKSDHAMVSGLMTVTVL